MDTTTNDPVNLEKHEEIKRERVVLIVIDGSRVNFKSLKKKAYFIGRNKEADIILKCQGVSRYHAYTYYRDDSHWIVDGDLEGIRSKNGLTVNGKKVYTHQLKNGDLIRFCQNVHALFLDENAIREMDPSAVFLTRNALKILLGRYRQNVKHQHSLFEREIKPEDDLVLGIDDLTKLPNRSTLLAKINQLLSLKSIRKHRLQFAVLFIDLDKFKLINDSLGHFAGDKFLIKVSERMRKSLRPKDMLARLGGDEFVVLLTEINDFDEAISVARRLQNDLEKPLWIGHNEIFPSASFGIASSKASYKSAEEILRDADTALYQAKSCGRGRLEVFDETMRQKARHLLKLDSDLRKATQQREFVLFYQPIVSLKNKKLVGFEALIRWQHPDRGLIMPDEFISFAEERHLIQEVGLWTLEEACRQLSLWKETYSSELSISINISPKQLLDTRLDKKIRRFTSLYDLSVSDIRIEVTEDTIVDDSQPSMQALNQLKEAGVQIYIDDFGTGYSSLSYLHKFPVDALKIDRSFISEIDKKSDESIGFSVTQSIIGLAHNLGVKVVAEGIENARHLFYLKASGCDYGQGYLFSKPLNAEQATHLVKHGLKWHWRC
ncbi:EAL domain-containing protein [Leptolyngbya sp. KIOST-1]|uniref:EAL domain-containing protein n=1 Tax=Leptolyngbya sp. KIOST-1 TaxID=1229172 RepID=UPI00069139A4|nr:EAL domain-containing protein [Leptolyngbya sp. KIOST-1]